MPSRKREAAHDLGRDENILRGLDEIAFRVAEKAEAFARKFR